MCRSELPSLRISISISFSKFLAGVFRNFRIHSPRAQAVAFKATLGALFTPLVCRHMFLVICTRLTDSLFVAQIGHPTAVWAAFFKRLLQKVAIPIFVEDQFALGRCAVRLSVPYFQESRRRVVRALDFHYCQVGASQYLNDL